MSPKKCKLCALQYTKTNCTLSKLKNTSGFTRQFQELLNLTSKQVIDIDEFEFILHKEYHWNNFTRENLTFRYIRGIISKLSKQQISKLKEYKDEQSKRQQSRKREELNKSFKFQRKRLSNLNLTEEQVWKYVKARNNWFKTYTDRRRSKPKSSDLEIIQIKKQIDKELIYTIFDSFQLQEYQKIVLKEERQNRKRSIKFSKDRFKNQYEIELSDEQASSLIEHGDIIPKKDKNGEYYSDFEQADLKLAKMESVLNPNQLEVYKANYHKEIEHIKENLKRSNSGHQLKQVNELKEYFIYYVENVLPFKCEARTRIEAILSDIQRKLIHELRMYYFDKLDTGLQSYEDKHFRYNKNLMPNELLQFKIRDKINRINPSGFYLYNCELAKDLMIQSLSEVVKKEYTQLEDVLIKLKKFQIESYERNGGTYGGHIMKVPIKEGEEHLEFIGLLLIEPKIEDNLKKVEMQ